MAKPKILLVDSDEKSLSMMTISLKKAGFNVTAGRNGEEAWELVRTSAPDLIISDTKMPRMDGFTFCRKLKEDPALRSIPFIFLTREKNVDDKIRGLELGVDDYLTKPIYLKEVLARVKLLLEKREKEKVDLPPAAEPQFSGSLQDMGVVDLIQTMELGQKTGVVYVSRTGLQGSMGFSKGRMIDARVAHVQGENAVYKLLLWGDGSFRIDFKNVDEAEATIKMSTQGLIMEGMRRIDELVRIKEQLPPLDSYLAIDSQMILEEHPDQFPEKIENILAEFTGQQTIQQVIDKLPHDDLESMEIIAKLYFQGFLMPVNPPAEVTAPDEESAPLFNFAPPEEDEVASIEHIFEKETVPPGSEPAAAKKAVPPQPPPAPKPPPAPEPVADEYIDVELEAAAAAEAGKTKPKQGKVIFLKGGSGGGAAAAKAEAPAPEPARPEPVEPVLETVPIPKALTDESKPAQKAKPAKAREIKMPASAPKPPAPKPAPEAPKAAPPPPPPPAPPPPAPPKIVIDTPPPAPVPAPQRAPMPAAATAAPARKSPAPLIAVAAAVLVAAIGGGAWFVTHRGGAPAAAPAGDAPAIEFRDTTIKLTGENLDVYRGASLDMGLDTATGYRRAIQGFEALASQKGWGDGTDQEIVLSKLILSYARLGAIQDDPAPLAKAAELSSAYLAERPTGPYLILADAEVKLRSGKPEMAKEQLRKLGGSAEKFYLYNFVDGLLRQAGGAPDLALVSFRKAIELEPSFTLGHAELGRAFDASRRQGDAAAEFQKVTELRPNHADALYRLAVISNSRGEADAALRYSENAVAVDQAYLPAQLLMAELLAAKSPARAQEHVDSVIELARPGKEDDLLVAAHKLAGKIALAAQDRDKAKRSYELALQISPSDEEARAQLASLGGSAPAKAAAAAPKAPEPKPAAAVKAAPPPAPAPTPAPAAKGPSPDQVVANRVAYTAAQDLYRRGLLKNAVERLQEALRAVPTDDKAYALLGQVYIELERNDEALKALQKALQLNPRNAEAYVNLGGLYDANGETAKANGAYKKYLELDPKGKFAADIRKLMSTRH